MSAESCALEAPLALAATICKYQGSVEEALLLNTLFLITENTCKYDYSPLQDSVGFSGGSVVKNPPVNAGNVVSIPGLGRSRGEGNGHPLQYSCLENPGSWWATGHGVAKE